MADDKLVAKWPKLSLMLYQNSDSCREIFAENTGSYQNIALN